MKQLLIKVLLPSIFLIGLFSCASNKNTTSLSQPKIFFPPPPDTARIQFLTVINDVIDIAGPPSFWSKLFTGKDMNGVINKPNGICSIKDRIYVIDTKTASIDIMNLRKKSFTAVNPTGLGNLRHPLNIYADTTGLLYIADQARKEIVVFDKDMNYKTSFGSKNLSKPTDVVECNGNLYVSDMDNSKIYVFSKNDYNLVSSFPEVNEKDTSFLHKPIHIAVRNEVLYVTDFGEFNIKKFKIDGTFIGTVGSIGDNPGSFSRPKGIAVDKNDLLYALDAQFNSIQIFDKLNHLLMFFGGEKIGHGFLDMPIRITIDYDNVDYFKEFVDPKYILKYLIYVTNQFGQDKITVYGFVDLK